MVAVELEQSEESTVDHLEESPMGLQEEGEVGLWVGLQEEAEVGLCEGVLVETLSAEVITYGN